MEKFLTQESPSKVMALLGTALFSMAFLFAVANNGAGFSGSDRPIADTMGPQNVVALLDVASNSYSRFLSQNLFIPAQSSYAIAADNIGYIASNARDEVALLTGVGRQSSQPQVAGAYVAAIHSSQ